MADALATPASAQDTADGWQDLTMTMEEVHAQVPRWFIAITLAIFIPYLLLWGLPDLPRFGAPATLLGAILVYGIGGAVVYLLSAFLHEGLHALAMITVAGVPWRSIRFGARWREGALYVHTSAPMTVRAYRVVLAVPGLVQGVVPLVLGFALGSGLWLVYGYVMFLSALGDILVLLYLRGVPGPLLARDHPSAIGCQVRRA